MLNDINIYYYSNEAEGNKDSPISIEHALHIQFKGLS